MVVAAITVTTVAATAGVLVHLAAIKAAGDLVPIVSLSRRSPMEEIATAADQDIKVAVVSEVVVVATKVAAAWVVATPLLTLRPTPTLVTVVAVEVTSTAVLRAIRFRPQTSQASLEVRSRPSTSVTWAQLSTRTPSQRPSRHSSWK